MSKKSEVKGRSPRLGVSVSEEFYAAIQAESERSRLTISTIVRVAVEDYMRQRGWDVKADVEWGGRKVEDDSGQWAGAGVP